MNAFALILCSVVAGADPAVSITSPQQVFDLQSRLYQLDKSPHFVVSEDRTLLQTPLMGYEYPANPRTTWKFDGKYDLRIVPCPDTPGCFLAGFVQRESPVESQEVNENGFGSQEGFGRRSRAMGHQRDHHFAIYVDAANNILLDLERNNLISHLTDEEVGTVKANLAKIAQPYVDQLKDNPQDPFIASYITSLQDEFIVTPPVEIECDLIPLPDSGPKLKMSFRLTAGERKVGIGKHYYIANLLTTRLAIPASRYFAAETQEEK
ncbi:hypothetical protein [Blastopirellula retiformator]|uniref:Uncharacterized protein n=1 Tax=Blastopirellula retiformator TaxID=2527970 RepID=A0A5C5V489_9BACT|nr:hypothetical protein [Blastopirellula retiformator]TWT32779.1 hypothetical protein Enr8_25850 [Blastopirellula retiformator]